MEITVYMSEDCMRDICCMGEFYRDICCMTVCCGDICTVV